MNKDQFKARVARITPEATITIVQPCPECDGRGFGDLRASCRRCGYIFTPEEMASENANDDTMACGCAWVYRHEEDYCRECEATGKEHLTVTMQELAFALFNMQPSLAE